MDTLRDQFPFWLSGPEAQAFADAAEVFWAGVEGWLDEALAQVEIANCSGAALVAHARDRSIARLPAEPEALWRSRVRHALTTAMQSGSRIGLEAILDAYGVTAYAILERQPDNDWDIVEIQLDPDALNGATTTLLDRIFHEWGRVCRRYVISHLVPTAEYVAATPVPELQTLGIAQ